MFEGNEIPTTSENEDPYREVDTFLERATWRAPALPAARDFVRRRTIEESMLAYPLNLTTYEPELGQRTHAAIMQEIGEYANLLGTMRMRTEEVPGYEHELDKFKPIYKKLIVDEQRLNNGQPHAVVETKVLKLTKAITSRPAPQHEAPSSSQ